MLVTTTPTLQGRRYQELSLVVAGSPPLTTGPSGSWVVNGYLYAISMLQTSAASVGANAVIAVHVVMANPNYILIAGTAIRLDDIPPDQPPPAQQAEKPWMQGTWDFLPKWTRDL